MNILENKRITAISAVFLLAFGGLVYYGFSRGQDLAATKAALADLNGKMEDFEAAKLPPTTANVKALQDAVKQVEKASDSLKSQMAKYEAYCMGNGKNITAVEFSNRVRASRDEIAALAGGKGCTLENPAKELGMGTYIKSYAQGEHVPYLTFQHEAIKRVVSIIINSGANSLDKVYSAPLPMEQINSRKPLAHFPLRFQVVFTAKRSTVTDGKTLDTLSPLPRVINAITTDKDFLLIPTGISIVSDGRLTDVDAYKDPASAPQGEDLGAEEDSKPQAEEGRIIATRKAGDPNEKVRVHLNIQVLYFPGKTK